MIPKTKVSVSVSIFETIFIKSQSQSQNLIPILKVSVSVSKIETGYTDSQFLSQHAKTGLAHPCYFSLKTLVIDYQSSMTGLECIDITDNIPSQHHPPNNKDGSYLQNIHKFNLRLHFFCDRILRSARLTTQKTQK